ncbi:MAG: hypothetical protein WCA46_12250, partial [Actinocatenispora sp.]
MLPESKSTGRAGPPPPAQRTPLIERVVAWSAAHRALAIAGWLLLVVLSVLASGLITGPGAPSADPGDSGRGQRVLDAQGDRYDPVRENVLIQRRAAGAAPFADDAA